MQDSQYEKPGLDHNDITDDIIPSPPEEVPVVTENVNSGHPNRAYYRSFMFVGTVLGTGLGLVNGTGVFALLGPVLGIINQELGPSTNYYWINLTYNLVLGVGFLLFGRVTDLFGRRWFVVGGNLLALIGTVVASRAHSINTIIGATVLLSLGAVPQGSFNFVLGECIPIKHRYAMSGLVFLFVVPANAFGPLLSYNFVYHTAGGWRWIYYFLSITNGSALVLSFFFYHPPTFQMKTRRSAFEMIKEFDWVGLILFSGGLLVFLMGLSWGGSAHPWDSAWVIATLVVGALASIAFVVYECYMPLKEPLLPMHLFKNIPWVITTLPPCLTVGCNYGFAIIWPQLAAIYATTPRKVAEYSCATGACFIFGAILAGLSGVLGKQRYQMIVASSIGAAALGAVACATLDNKTTVLGLLTTGFIAIGFCDSVGLNASTILTADQNEIGAAFGAASTWRNVVATLAVAIYLTVLQNRLATTIPQQVPPALIEAGLPESSVAPFIEGLTSGSFSKVPGVNANIIAVGVRAYHEALILAFRTVIYTALAFLLLNFLSSLVFPNTGHKMTAEVAAQLRSPRAVLGGGVRNREQEEAV